MNIEYYKEEKPLGTAGALGCLKNKLTEDFFVFYGDTVMDFDMDAMLAYHKEKQADATLFLHPNDHPYDSDIVELTTDGRVLKFCNKPHVHDFVSHNMVNAALFIFSPKVLEQIEVGTKSHIEKHVLPACLDKGMNLFGYVSFEYIKDMGTPDRYYSVCDDVTSGKVGRLNRRYTRPAIFLDRDGVISKEVNLLCKPEQVELIEGVGEAIRYINQTGYLAIVVTNQPVIARNLCSLEELDYIHAKLETLLGYERAYLNAIYYHAPFSKRLWKTHHPPDTALFFPPHPFPELLPLKDIHKNRRRSLHRHIHLPETCLHRESGQKNGSGTGRFRSQCIFSDQSLLYLLPERESPQAFLSALLPGEGWGHPHHSPQLPSSEKNESELPLS